MTANFKRMTKKLVVLFFYRQLSTWYNAVVKRFVGMERKTVFDYPLYFPYTLYTKKLKLKPTLTLYSIIIEMF